MSIFTDQEDLALGGSMVAPQAINVGDGDLPPSGMALLDNDGTALLDNDGIPLFDNV